MDKDGKHYPDRAPIILWSFMPLCGAEEGVDDNDSHPRLVCDAKWLGHPRKDSHAEGTVRRGSTRMVVPSTVAWNV